MSSHTPTIKGFPRPFIFLLANTLFTSITTMTVWFAIIFYAYLQTQAVLTTAIISGVFLVAIALSGFWLGNLVDHHKKKGLMLISGWCTVIFFAIALLIYNVVPHELLSYVGSPTLWLFILTIMAGVIVGNVRGIALPTLVTIMIPEDKRDRANGMVGTATGIAMLVVSAISGFLVAHSGMQLALIIGVVFSALANLHLWSINIPETDEHIQKNRAEKEKEGTGNLGIRGTLKAIRSVPGLFTLILFTTFNNFIGGVFMALLDAYGLTLVSVEVWGLLWALVSTAFIAGGIFISVVGLGKNPLRTLFLVNITVWTTTIFFTIQPSIVLLIVGCYIYLALAPFAEAAEHTIVQKVVTPERQGRVFGFAASIEQAASPITAFLIGPIAQFLFIPFMSEGGEGARLIGSWFGVGLGRGIALVFVITGIIGLTATLFAMQTRFYRDLSASYAEK